MSTVRDLITAALLDLGAIASGEAPTATEAADGLRRLNLLLETWRLESLMVWSIDTVTLALTGAASYTWGPGGAIPSSRPVRLEHAVQRLAGTSPALDVPLEVLTDGQYESIGLKGLQSSIARWVYLDAAFPLATLRTWPVLPSGDTLLLSVWHPLTAFASLDTTVALPPGYELALQTNLSLELVSMFRDCTVTPALAAQAVRSKALIKVINTRARFLTLPAGLPTGRRGGGGVDRAGFRSGGNS
jgi:hypothetical protein